MDIKEFAKSISGKEYGYSQFTKEEIEIAEENGFVIVYGASDDLMEFEGAIYDEVDCYDGGFTEVFCNGYISKCTPSSYEKNPKNKIKSLWCNKEALDENGNIIAWTYETDIPHETFMIYEDGEPYCRGIVFSIEDLK